MILKMLYFVAIEESPEDKFELKYILKLGPWCHESPFEESTSIFPKLKGVPKLT